MNQIFLANLEAMIKAKKFIPPNSTSKKIIEYLFINGKSSGADIMQALSIKSSPKVFIHPHLATGRVICERITNNHAEYSINPSLSAADFGLTID